VETRLVVTSGRTSSKEIALSRFPVTVGRHRECQLRVTSRLVSRRHCLLDQEDGWLAVEDLGSSNGTVVNGQRISQRTVIKPGDSLEVGPIAFEIHYDPPGSNGASTNIVSSAADDDTTLVDQTVSRSPSGSSPVISDKDGESDRVSDLADTHALKHPSNLDNLDPNGDAAAVLRAFEQNSAGSSDDLDDLSWLKDE
jgi:predicted component of type VI protein secretion system